MWEFREFSATQNLREINFRSCRSSKSAIFAVLEPLNVEFGRFQPSKIERFSFIQDSESFKTQKMADLNFWKFQN